MVFWFVFDMHFVDYSLVEMDWKGGSKSQGPSSPCGPKIPPCFVADSYYWGHVKSMLGGFHGHGGTPIAGWMVSRRSQFKMDDDIWWLGVPPILGNYHVLMCSLRLSARSQVLPRALVEVHLLRHLGGFGTVDHGPWTVFFLWYPVLIWVISCQ